jgi:flagellar protein FliO/FliZ
MLLVKQNALKNCAKLMAVLLMTAISYPSFANVAKTSNTPDFLRMVLSLLIVLGVIFLLAFVVKKLKISPNSQKHIRTVANLSVGQKERVVVIEVNNEQFIIGVTAHNVNLLHKLEHPINVEAKDELDSTTPTPRTIQALFKKGNS